MKRTLISALLIAAGVVAVPVANASVIASSVFSVSNFLLLNADGNVPTGINVLSGSRNGEMAIGFNGANDASTGNASAVGDLDLAPICLGPSCNPTGDNSTTVLPPNTGSFARSDMFVSGNAFTAGAAGLTRSDAYALAPTVFANSNSTIANNVLASYVIDVAADATLRFVLAADVYLKALIEGASLGGPADSANASISFSIDVTNNLGQSVFNWAPSELNRGVSAFDVAGFNDVGGATNYSLASNLVNLGAGGYNVTIQQKSTARISAVPEPATMALVGLGLLGVWGAGRRRQVK